MVSKTIMISKNSEFMYFDVENKTKNSFIPIDLISDPPCYTVDL